MIAHLALLLFFGILIRRAIVEMPEIEHVAWIIVALATISLIVLEFRDAQ